MAAAQIQTSGGEIVLAVGSRVSQGTLHVYRLDPNTGAVSSQPVNIPLSDIPRRVASADFNGDNWPDFVTVGHGPVDAVISNGSGGYTRLVDPIHAEGDDVAATDTLVAVGGAGSRRGDTGEVFFYDVTGSLPSFSPSAAGPVAGPGGGSKFGEAVGLGNVVGNGSVDLVAGAPGVDGSGRKQTDYGEVLVSDRLTGDPGPFDFGVVKNDKLGWQVAIDGQTVLVASKWTSSTRRVEVYHAVPTGADSTLIPPGPLSLSDGWASGGIATGTVAGTRSAIVGAPNANCDGSGSTGVAYLYDIGQGLGDIGPSDVFVPPVAVDPNGDSWNVFGWSNAIVETSGGSFVIIGEPGREAADVHDGQVYVYRLGGPVSN